MTRKTLPLALVLVALGTLPFVLRATGAAPTGPLIADVLVEAVDPGTTDGVADRRVEIRGANFFGTAFGPFVRFRAPGGEPVDAPIVILESDTLITAYPPRGLTGPVTLEVENPDRQAVSRAVSL